MVVIQGHPPDHRYPSGVGVRRRDLIEGEEVVVEFRSSGRLLVAPILLLVALAALVALGVARLHGSQRAVGVDLVLAAGALAALWAVLRWLRWRSKVIAITTERVLLVEGIARKRTDQVTLSRITEVHVDQRFVDRLFGRGAVILELEQSSPVVIDGVRRPDALARLLRRSVTPRQDRSSLLGGLPVIVGDGDPTPPRGTPAVSAPGATSALIRRDEIDRLEASGALSFEEAARRRDELGWPGHA